MQSTTKWAWWAAGLGVVVACGGQTSQLSGGSAAKPTDRYDAGNGGAGTGGTGAGGTVSAGGVGVSGQGVGGGGALFGAAGTNVAGRPGSGSGGRAAKDAGLTCDPLPPPDVCAGGIECVSDFRAVASRFLTCSTGPTGMTYWTTCGPYDVAFQVGEDTSTEYYFDHSDGHLAGVHAAGNGQQSCEAADPSFVAVACDPPAPCRDHVAGTGFFSNCTPQDPPDAGSPPAFCPPRASPRPVRGTKPAMGVDPNSITVKFVEGSHVRIRENTLFIDPLAMLDEDPGLLRCADLSVPDAVCDVEDVNFVSFAYPDVTIARPYTQSETELDRQRAEARAKGGEYLDDPNLFYTIRASAQEIPTLFDEMVDNPVIDDVTYTPVGVPAQE